MSSILRRALLAATLSTGLCGVAASTALGATVTNAGGVLTYTGGGAANNIDFTRTAPGEVTVDRNESSDPEPIDHPAPGCTAVTPGDTYVCGGVTRVVANGGAGNDYLNATDLADIPFTANGGDGDDDVGGGASADTLNGDAGVDNLSGRAGGDTINGGAGNDVPDGGEDGDTISGGPGEDYFQSGDGNDVQRGEGGNDRFFGDQGNDDVRGGDGYDTVVAAPAGSPAPSLTVTLDDAANDRLWGPPGETDNVHADVEGVEMDFLGIVPSGNDTVIGNGGANSLSGGTGNDTVDGGGANDMLSGGGGSDTIRARDGYADFVNCGEGADTAEVDTLDTVQECETVDRADVGNANDVPEVPEDRPPAVAFTAPAPGRISANRPTTLAATASDDRGVARVLFLDDDRIVCTDTTAPYTCAYQPRGDDVGRNTLAAVAVDAAEQTGFVTRTVTVPRFRPGALSLRLTPGRDRTAPYRFTALGRLRLPASVSAASGCAAGFVAIQFKAGKKTVSTKRVRIRRDCTYRSTKAFNLPERLNPERLRVQAIFAGNSVLTSRRSARRSVRVK